MLLKFDKLDVIDYVILASIKNGVKNTVVFLKIVKRLALENFENTLTN